jgi:hypothetical protein
MKTFEKVSFNSTSEAEKRYSEVVDELKKEFNVDFVANYDLTALYTNFQYLGAGDFHSYKHISHEYHKTGYLPSIRSNGIYTVLCIDFESIAVYFDPSFTEVTGWNNSEPANIVKGDYYSKETKLILCQTEEQKQQLNDSYNHLVKCRIEWQEFEEIKNKMSPDKLGERFEIGQTVADHFLNCMPPIYGENCFLMGEPYCCTPEGETVYYCIRGLKYNSDQKATIEYNTVKNCR